MVCTRCAVLESRFLRINCVVYKSVYIYDDVWIFYMRKAVSESTWNAVYLTKINCFTTQYARDWIIFIFWRAHTFSCHWYVHGKLQGGPHPASSGSTLSLFVTQTDFFAQLNAWRAYMIVSSWKWKIPLSRRIEADGRLILHVHASYHGWRNKRFGF